MAEALPHPRDVFDLIGHEAPEAAFEDARSRGRLHHAWLLNGPEGVGKASFAYRMARRLLEQAGLKITGETSTGLRRGDRDYWKNLATLGLLSQLFVWQHLLRGERAGS